MFASFERQFPDTYREQMRTAEQEGRPRVDLSFAMVREAAPIFVTMTEMFDVADAFCRAERLLSMARTPGQRELQNWLLGELVHQLDGAEATPWAGRRGGPQSASQAG